MIKKPVLYVEHFPTDKKRLLFDFCYSAKMGAEFLGINVKVFEDSSEVPEDPTNILVGSVEQCSKWLDMNGYGTPDAIDISIFGQYLRREVAYMDMDDFTKCALEMQREGAYEPMFIKPATKIKAFTGFVVDDPKMISLWSNNFTGRIQIQPVIDNIFSEYRCYISNNKIVGMKHYLGDPLLFPNAEFIRECKKKGDELNLHSYTLDFGVTEDNETLLIESNDGWAIGNYGLDPETYYLFVRNRWLQMTNIRTKMDGIL
jgi:hypothetical protein